METTQLQVNTWLQKEIVEFMNEFESHGYNSDSAYDEALDCLGLVAMGAKISALSSEEIDSLLKSTSTLGSETFNVHFNKWTEKQNSRGRKSISIDELSEARLLIYAFAEDRTF